MVVLSLAGKSCVITGATGGIGFAVARRFAQEGARITLVGRDETKLRGKLEELEMLKSATHPRPGHQTIQTDILQPDGWKDIVTACPTIDVLINCSGITQNSRLLTMRQFDVQNLFSVNLYATTLGCQHVGKHMFRKKTQGCIVNVSSLLAKKGTIGTSVYAASKAGLLGLTTSLAVEYGQSGIRVNAILPGYIETAMTQDLPQKTLIDAIPLKRFGTVDEVADAAAFLAKNEYANNCILNLDGGLSAA